MAASFGGVGPAAPRSPSEPSGLGTEGLATLGFLSRAGYGAKGIIIVTLGLLAANAAIRTGDRAYPLPVDQRIAVRAIHHGPLGSILVAALCAGLLCYSGWQGARAILDPDHHGRGWRGLLRRGWYLWLALLNLALAASGAALAAGLASQGEYHAGARTWSLTDVAGTLLSSHAFRRLLVAAGAAALLYGLVRITQAIALQFRSHRKRRDPAERLRRWRRRVHRLNLVSRGAVGLAGGCVLVLVGGYFNSGIDLERGYDEYEHLLHQHFSRAVLVAVAAGFLSWGVYCLLRACRPGGGAGLHATSIRPAVH